MDNKREVRFLQLMELRAEQNEQEYILEGYPIARSFSTRKRIRAPGGK